MDPRWAAASLAIALAACGEPTARQFVVTLTDSPEVACTFYVDGLYADPEQLEEAADDAEDDWEEAQLADPVEPAGRLLWVTELEDTMHAWFEPTASAASYYDPLLGIHPGEEQLVLYAGEVHDDYIEGTYADEFNSDEVDKEAGLNPCGDRRREYGTLSLTTRGGALGRIRWTDVGYIGSELSNCEGRIECVRDIAVEGSELQ